MDSKYSIDNVLSVVKQWYDQVGAVSMLWDGHSAHVNSEVVHKLDSMNINYIPFSARGSHVLNGYPPRRNDFNPVENVIPELKRRIWKKNPKTMNQLWNAIRTVWKNFEVEFWSPHILSMDDRLNQCIERNGDKTKY